MADANKPTSVAASVAKMEREAQLAAELADKKAAKEDVPPDLVLVRLRRPCFDSTGIFHSVDDPVLLMARDVPTTAKILVIGDEVDTEEFSAELRKILETEEAKKDAKAKAAAPAKAPVKDE